MKTTFTLLFLLVSSSGGVKTHPAQPRRSAVPVAIFLDNQVEKLGLASPPDVTAVTASC
jgi:hypothetical protein